LFGVVTLYLSKIIFPSRVDRDVLTEAHVFVGVVVSCMYFELFVWVGGLLVARLGSVTYYIVILWFLLWKCAPRDDSVSGLKPLSNTSSQVIGWRYYICWVHNPYLNLRAVFPSGPVSRRLPRCRLCASGVGAVSPRWSA